MCAAARRRSISSLRARNNTTKTVSAPSYNPCPNRADVSLRSSGGSATRASTLAGRERRTRAAQAAKPKARGSARQLPAQRPAAAAENQRRQPANQNAAARRRRGGRRGVLRRGGVWRPRQRRARGERATPPPPWRRALSTRAGQLPAGWEGGARRGGARACAGARVEGEGRGVVPPPPPFSESSPNPKHNTTKPTLPSTLHQHYTHQHHQQHQRLSTTVHGAAAHGRLLDGHRLLLHGDADQGAARD